MNDPVLSFIHLFDEARNLFLCGMCYWFSEILCSRFGGLMFYLPVQNHFVTWIDGRYYDASGDVSSSLDEPPILWSTYAASDPNHAERIRRDCILKIDGGELDE